LDDDRDTDSAGVACEVIDEVLASRVFLGVSRMWNLFRRKPAEEPFPTPKWPPIQSPDSIDITGKRHDGGLDLGIVASQPIDDSPQTLESIRRKVGMYLTAIGLEEFQAEMGHPPREKTTIIIVCEHPIHPKALTVIGQCRATAAAEGVHLEVRKSIDSPPITLPEGGNEVEQSIRSATEAEREQLSGQIANVLALLRSRYGDVRLLHTEDDLRLLQRLQDDGILQADQRETLECVGVAFGQVLAKQSALRWVIVEWEGERVLGLQYPNTTVIVFPDSMISKRINRGERVEFASLFQSVVEQVEQMKDAPEYQR
jgi:hypothetical protein